MVDVTSVCKNCGQKKSAKSFVMSLEAKKMVCAECEKTLKNMKKPAIKNEYKTSFIGKPSVKPSLPVTKPVITPAKAVMFSAKQSSPPTKPLVKPAKQLDYDEDDKELERLNKSKNGLKKSDSYRCHKCGYLFDHSATVGKVYKRCPFCNTSL